jgi:hypothetical protein
MAKIKCEKNKNKTGRKHIKTIMGVSIEEPKESLSLVSQGSSVHEAQIPMLNTTGNKSANYSTITERAGYNGGLQSQFTSGSPFSQPAIIEEDLARAMGSLMADFFQKDAGNTNERLVFVNAKQYKGILKHRQTRKLRQPHKKKFTMILPKVNNISSKASHASVEQIEIKDLKPNLDKAEVFEANKEDRKAVNHDKKDLYSPTSTPLMWPFELYVKELMSMKRRLEILEEKRWYEGNEVNEIDEFKSKLKGENKALKEQISSMQVKMEIGQQEVTALKQELEQMRITKVEKSELVKKEDTTQRQ